MTDRLLPRSIFMALLALLLMSATQLRAGEFLFVDNFENTATLTGRVLDTNAFVDSGIELPVQGVVVRLLGVSGSSVTGPDGFFILRNVPSGEQVLDLNTASAMPAPTGDTYAGFRERIVLAGFENIARPLYLPRIDASSLTTIDPSQTTVVENPGLEISMTVVANSAMAEDGSPFDGQLSISEVPDGLAPAALPSFLEPGLLITVQPVGVTFDPPAPITFPNIDNLPPGSGTDLWSLDPESGQFIVVGTGEVSADGERIETVTGGIIAADWHGPPPPPPRPGDGDGDGGPPTCAGCCPSCGAAVGSSVDLFNGEFSETVRLPEVISLNQPFAPEFVYRSKRAFPLSVIPVNTGIVERAAIPNMISYQGFINDELVQDEIFIDTSTLNDANEEPFRVAVPFDNTARTTGIYEADVFVTSIYDRSRISRSNPTPLTVVNSRNSPFGAGWSLAGLDRLVLDEPGTIRERILLERGDGGSIQFEEQLTGVNPDGIITIISLNDQTQPVQSQETAALVDVLTDMGFASQVVDAVDFSQEHVDQSRLLIWVDSSFVIIASNLDIQHVPGLLLEARANGMPLYFLGSEPANFRDFTNDGTADVFIDSWLDLVHLNLASNTNGGQGVVNVLDTDHPIFDGPAGGFTQYEVAGDVDLTRGSNTGETVLASTATADIVLVNEFEAGGRTVVQNHTFLRGQPVDFEDEIEIVIRNSVDWLLDSPSITSGFFGEGQFAAVDGDYSGIVREPGTGTFTRILKDGTMHLFDAAGHMTSVIDRNGNTALYAYDGAGRLQTITDPVGRVTTFAYDGNGKLDSVTDPAGRITGFSVDSAGNLSEVTFPDSSTRGFGYDARHLMTSQTSQRGLTTQYVFDDLGFFSQSTQPDGSVRQVSAAQKIGLVDTSGGLGSAENPAPIVRPATALSGFTDPEGRVLVAKTGTFGEPVAVSGFDGLETNFTRNNNGNPLSISPPSGRVIDSTFDNDGNRLSVTDQSLGGTWLFEYESEFSNPIGTTDPFGNTSTFEFDSSGNLTSVTTAAGRTQSLTWSAQGLPVSSTSANGTASQYTYNNLGLVERTDEGAGLVQRTTEATHTAAGDVQVLVDAESGAFTYGYDANGRPTSLTLPDTELLTIDWDAENNLIELVPPGRLAHQFTYTQFGALASYQPPDITGPEDTNYSYNSAQQLTQISRPDGRTVVLSYDGFGRKVSRQLARGNTTLIYDGLTGLLSSVTAPGGEGLAYSYTGNLLSGQSWSGTVSGDVNFELDAAGRVSSESVNGASEIVYTYDADDFVTQAGALSIARDVNTGDVTGTSLGLITDTYTFNAFGEIASYVAFFDGTPVYSFDLTRDKLGRTVSETETVLSVSTDYDYFYDPRDRLTEVQKNSVTSAEYTYDSNSNRAERDDGLIPEVGVYDNQDRLASYAGFSYTYRQSGELLTRTLSGNTTSFLYDEVGNLVEVELPSSDIVTFVIDGHDRRIGRAFNGVLTTGWLYRDELNPVAELDGFNHLVSRFVYGTRSNVPDYMIRAGNTYRIISDQIGSVRLVIDIFNGTVAQRLDYDEFGRIVNDTNPGFQPFAYAGGLYESSTDLVRFGARDYDPIAGRWTAKDPIGFAGGDTNLYAYALNSPLDRADPNGLSPAGNTSGGDAPTTDLGDPIARVVKLSEGGHAYVTRANGTWERVHLEMDIFVGDKIETGFDTFSSIELYTGGQIGINRRTKICITSEDTAEVIDERSTLQKIRDSFRNRNRGKPVEIRTSSGVMGIRG